MRLLGRDISTDRVLAAVSERLFARGLSGVPDASEVTLEGVEARVDPMAFAVSALGEHADSTRGLPLETHRDGLAGRAVTAAKKVFRRAGQLFINEALARQVVFNTHVRDSYAQLSAEVLSLRARLVQLEQQLAAQPPTIAHDVAKRLPSQPQPKKKPPRAMQKPAKRLGQK